MTTESDDLGSLSRGLIRVLDEIQFARTQGLTDHPLARFIRGELRNLVAALAGATYQVKGSVGQGQWAETVWIGIFDPLVTTSAQRGFYLVYLFKGNGTGVHLSLNQGTTRVLEAVGGAEYLDVLKTTAKSYFGLLGPNRAQGFQSGPIDLPGRGELTRGYAVGNVVSRYYPRSSFPNADPLLRADLVKFLDLYRVLVETHDEMARSQEELQEAEVSSGEEGRKLHWHLRAERNARLAQDAKRYHGDTCQVCGFNFERRYGTIGNGFIEAHHLTPFASLQGRPTTLDPKTDFAVVCSNCHRMLHRAKPQLSTGELNSRLRP